MCFALSYWLVQQFSTHTLHTKPVSLNLIVSSLHLSTSCILCHCQLHTHSGSSCLYISQLVMSQSMRVGSFRHMQPVCRSFAFVPASQQVGSISLRDRPCVCRWQKCDKNWQPATKVFVGPVCLNTMGRRVNLFVA